MGQSCCRANVGGTTSSGLCCLTQESQEPKYARYLGNSEDDLDLPNNIVGNALELDPVVDRDVGEERINNWIESSAPNLGLPESDVGINRLKCLKYWEAVLAKDVSKLNGSTMHFCFEKKSPEEQARLVIEHRGKPVFIRNASKRASKKEQSVSRPLMELPEQSPPPNGPRETEI